MKRYKLQASAAPLMEKGMTAPPHCQERLKIDVGIVVTRKSHEIIQTSSDCSYIDQKSVRQEYHRTVESDQRLMWELLYKSLMKMYKLQASTATMVKKVYDNTTASTLDVPLSTSHTTTGERYISLR
jgi:hypothetical protein